MSVTLDGQGSRFNVYKLADKPFKELTEYEEKLVNKLNEALESISDKGERTEDVWHSKASGRTQKSQHKVRVSQAKLNLDRDQMQAEKDIATAIEFLESGGGIEMIGFKSKSFMHIGGGVGSIEDSIAHRQKLAGRYHEWEFDLAAKGLQKFALTTRAMIKPDTTARHVAKLAGVRHETIVNWFKEGLDAYVEQFY